MLNGYYKIESNQVGQEEFLDEVNNSNFFRKCNIIQITDPAYQLRYEFIQHITKHGLESIYKSTIMSEVICSPSRSINDTLSVLNSFVSTLKGVKRLVIIDPYFYAVSKTTDTSNIFTDLLLGISQELKEVIFITNGKQNQNQSSIHTAIKSINSSITVSDFHTDEFHDRFWIDPDSDRGIVIGTSLNGIAKKIFLVDLLKPKDVSDIVKLAKQLGVQI